MQLFTPVRIGTLEVKNRIVMPAMVTHYASQDGQVTDRMVRYYEERAKGGVGLVIVEATCVERSGKCSPLMNMIDNDKMIAGLEKLVGAIKRYGAKAALQLVHGGIKGSAKFSQMQPVGPSVFSAYPSGMGPSPRVLTITEINRVISDFSEAARRAKEAGFDAIELHCSHSYLIDEFISPRFNQRTDMYGGNIENRARFACEAIRYIKEKIGEDYPVICRITGDEGVVGGILLEDAKVTARLITKAGADALHISVGISDNLVSTPPQSFPYGCFLHLSEGIKRVVNVPVIGVGRINTPECAEQALHEGKADLVAMGRALIADPYLPQKAIEGRVEDIIPCIYCNQGCITRVLNGLDITCLVNPMVGREAKYQIISTKMPKKILIAGAGPAGLEAAIIAKQRGHNVILVEKKKYLGGQLNYAFKPPNKEVIEKLIDYFSKQVKKLGIKIHLGEPVTKEFVRQIRPDLIIIATGSFPKVPESFRIQGDRVLFATEVLEGKKFLGQKTIVIGGGQVGLETADFLSDAGKDVTVIEMLSDVGMDMPPRNKMFLMKRLSKKNVQILANRKVIEISNNGVRADYFGHQVEFMGDIVVIATGSSPDRTLLKELEEIIPDLEGFFIIGDCVEPRKALEAIYEGARIAKDI